MATYQDVSLSTTAWTNVHSAHSIAAGTPITVQNKTIFPIVMFVSSTTPPDSSSGFVVGASDYTMYQITPASGEFLWARSFGNSGTVIGVQ